MGRQISLCVPLNGKLEFRLEFFSFSCIAFVKLQCFFFFVGEDWYMSGRRSTRLKITRFFVYYTCYTHFTGLVRYLSRFQVIVISKLKIFLSKRVVSDLAGPARSLLESMQFSSKVCEIYYNETFCLLR